MRQHSETTAERKWKQAVRERDDFACQRCGASSPYIHAHHISPRSRRPDLKLVVSNGICLCHLCHLHVHNHPAESTALGFLSTETYELAQKQKWELIRVIVHQREESQLPDSGWHDCFCIEDESHHEVYQGGIEAFAEMLIEMGWSVDSVERGTAICKMCANKEDESHYAEQYREGAGGLL